MLKRMTTIAALVTAATLLCPVPGLALTDEALPVTTEQRQATGLIVHLMSNYHYLKSPIDDALSKLILQRYLDSLDPNRSIFLRSDIEGFDAYRANFDDFLRTGYLTPAFDIFKIFRARVAERNETAMGYLDTGFDFTVEETFELRDEKSDWPTTLAEMNELWRKKVKNDFLSLRLAERTDAQAKDTLEKRYSGMARRSQQFDSEDVFQLFMNAYTTAVEPHTAYLSPRSSENFKIRMSLSLEGIGAALQTENEYTVVRRIIPGGPADLSGQLHVDDRVIGVGQGTEEAMVDVVSWRLEDVVELIRGPKDTVVRLEILPKDGGGDGPSETIMLVRSKVELEDQAAKKSVLDLSSHHIDKRIGVINVPTFYLDMAAMAEGEANYRSTTRDVRQLIEELRREEVDGIIIDLRANGGGSLAEATELTGLFIASGPIVQVRDSSGKVKVNDDPDPGIAYEGPLAVLVDRNSASASEIFAGAIQDYRRGVIIGEPTYGKGTVQNVIDLNRFVGPEVGPLGQLKVTIAQFFRINGDSTQHRGVVPDIVYPTAVDAADEGERSLDNALPWATIPSTAYQPSGNLIEALPRIKSEHENRISHDPGFEYLLEEARARESIEDLAIQSLLESKRKQEIETRKKEGEERLNRFRASRGLPPVSDTDLIEDESEPTEEDDGLDDEGIDGEDTDGESIDVLLDEAGLILIDLIEAGGQKATLQASTQGDLGYTVSRDAH